MDQRGEQEREIQEFRETLIQFIRYSKEIEKLNAIKKVKNKYKKELEEDLKQVLLRKKIEVELKESTLKAEVVEVPSSANKKFIMKRTEELYRDESEREKFLKFIYDNNARKSEVKLSLKLKKG